jgi:VWFA-related protein
MYPYDAIEVPMTTIKACVGGLVVAACILVAQTSGHRVMLHVIAVDSHGQPVTDLKGDELRVADDGKPQAITAFAAPGAEDRRPATLILLDFLNMDAGNRVAIADQTMRSLEGLESGGFLSLYLLTNDGRVYTVHALPGKQPSASGDSWTKQIRPLLQQAIENTAGMRSIPERDQGFQSAATFNALDGVAAQLAAIPGHKNIIWITHGVLNHVCCPYSCSDVTFHSRSGDYLAGQHEFGSHCPNSGIDYKPFLRHFSEQLAQDDTAVYTLEAASGASVVSDAGGPRDTLVQVAGLTGGRMYNSGTVDKVIAQALQDVRATYQIGYDPPAASGDGKYHKLRVTCVRKGVQIQTRQGYYAER